MTQHIVPGRVAQHASLYTQGRLRANVNQSATEQFNQPGMASGTKLRRAKNIQGWRAYVELRASIRSNGTKLACLKNQSL
ncbi:hypothetical protein RAS12_02005 [Achromobacter seleniivolatilans]|uniref:Uncharacterized protein n=1 Tax=Achromobacter seleniivolatilans TaxID=3047478 RepID=A0ABY9M4Q6_9BURK|nr:hypothetical protein [Achromobacter sp. R39]WMD21163.1 hypothetical protein RAS12_02005 [Achromobacter sp. R39]